MTVSSRRKSIECHCRCFVMDFPICFHFIRHRLLFFGRPKCGPFCITRATLYCVSVIIIDSNMTQYKTLHHEIVKHYLDGTFSLSEHKLMNGMCFKCELQINPFRFTCL